MATRQSPSREPSVSRPSLRLRRSLSRLSNPDVFSDDFALSSRGNSPDASPVDSIDSSSENLPVHALSQPAPPRLSTIIPPSYLNGANFSRPSSTSKRPLMLGDGLPVVPHRAISSVSHSDAATQRSSSVSSHVSIPRAQSPYNGPTAPSQPYAMYPQVTRASSIASESTIRPAERPYVSTGGPEHPYGMYPQNTVEEEDDDDVHDPGSTIPLGFPGMGQIYRRNQATGHDLGDIVGHDGHVEQLPPYTRYADNTIAKAACDDVPDPVAAVDVPLSPTATSPTSDSEVNINTGASRALGEPTTEYNEKSGTKRRLRRKVCWGISLCVWLLVVGVIVIAATLGGVIGGVIGNNRASEEAADSAPTATTTVWLDAAPLPTGVPPPNCTPGEYDMPTSDPSLDTPSCILEPQYSAAWGCLKEEPVPFGIRYIGATPRIALGAPGPGKIPGQGFNYGAQVPDLNGSLFPLGASIDKDDPKAGGAMFLHVLYNKLTVVHESIFSSNSKRSFNFVALEERASASTPVSINDKPYFCWFNQTLLELFIYSNVSTQAAAANSTAYVYAPSTTTDPNSFSRAMSTSMAVPTNSSLNIAQVSPPMTPAAPSYTDINPWPTTSYTWPPSERLARRQDGDNGDDGDDDEDEDYRIYPKQVRLAEKRAPSGDDVKPYCVQMEINPDWSVREIEGTTTMISEVEPNYPRSSRRWNRARQANGNNNLDSDCACQWYST